MPHGALAGNKLTDIWRWKIKNSTMKLWGYSLHNIYSNINSNYTVNQEFKTLSKTIVHWRRQSWNICFPLCLYVTSWTELNISHCFGCANPLLCLVFLLTHISDSLSVWMWCVVVTYQIRKFRLLCISNYVVVCFVVFFVSTSSSHNVTLPLHLLVSPHTHTL